MAIKSICCLPSFRGWMEQNVFHYEVETKNVPNRVEAVNSRSIQRFRVKVLKWHLDLTTCGGLLDVTQTDRIRYLSFNLNFCHLHTFCLVRKRQWFVTLFLDDDDWRHAIKWDPTFFQSSLMLGCSYSSIKIRFIIIIV